MSIGIDIVRGQAIQSIGALSHEQRLTVMTDSRNMVENGLFVPLKGERFNGHQFLEQAIQNGAVAAVWMEREPLPENVPEGFPVFFVRDTLVALQSMAKSYLNQVNPKIIAVTGSNGKTTTKDMIHSILSQTFKVYKTQGNLNNHIGVPLTILSMPEDTQILVLEMGMNHFGELTFLSQLAKPKIAVITNIGESHIEYLGSREGIAKAKLEIVKGLRKKGTLIIDGDEPLLANIHSHAFQIVRCGYGMQNEWQITEANESVDGASFSLNGKQERFSVPVLGKHNVKNAVYSFAVARLLGADMEMIRHGLERLRLTKMRFEKVAGMRGSVLINDCYNANPTSMKASVETLKALPGFERRVAVLGDMYELGENEMALHESVADVLTKPLTHVVTIGSKGAWIAEGLRKRHSESELEVHTYATKEEAVTYLDSLLDEKTIMLFKASRLLALEELSDKFRA
ncbi:UDP-N-acetylmuramoyl-tripeptide--D-alanyl-D-alanine ligase [Sporolactobacillus sp. CPB3-1]|uniref:UDP-N-acetylmuramoyl-tripeptide--D-alanyl-D-alanine ligase n=1 Tax=Sporolactobacillus mangiferae TaxID=2940498 RepID=A0ABT0M7W0_9BACL|nr:UDP-N-acetylmuramoyl-tripeptide--D-alanyl-D-alanine ligase [Sporolactobacillus mangiferae]MCL1630946.1 UDP-N-acetylmuramoyl-tripeptide--D-alanyl-D-alanine ligase [Sporolactobacillus mangiferae]